MLTLTILVLLMLICMIGVTVGLVSIKVDLEHYQHTSFGWVAWHCFLTIAFLAAFIGLFAGWMSIVKFGAAV